MTGTATSSLPKKKQASQGKQERDNTLSCGDKEEYDNENSRSSQEQHSEISNDENGNDNCQSDGNIVYVCGLVINIESITKAQILKLRKLMPRKDYRQLKNRKSARECRRKRKAER